MNGPQQMMAQQGGFGAGFGTGMAPMGFGGQQMGGFGFGGPQMGGFGFGNDPITANNMNVNNSMNALAQQTMQFGQVMEQMMAMIGVMIDMMFLKQMQALVSQMGNFGGGGGGTPGVGNFLGSGGGGGGAAPAGGAAPSSGAPAVTNGNFGPMPAWAAELGKYAGDNANGPGGWCYKWVGQALRKFGVNVSGASAYMAADQLAKNPKFREISVQPKDLPKLPAGAVVVWNKGSGHPHGHISIALGNGKEASDKLRQQITNYGTSVRVFLPK